MVDLLRPVAAEDAGNADFIKRMLTAYHTRSGVAAPAVSQTTMEGMGTRRPLPAPLTSREVEVLELLAQGLYQKEIAERLFVSAETVKTHLKHIYQKLGARDRRQAVALGRAQNLLARAWDASSPSAATV
jgi:ATP/maltotriose-dependent transcriptional regulator MalT